MPARRRLAPLIVLIAALTVPLAASERVSVGTGGVQADRDSLLCDLSDNGRYALFASRADNLRDFAPGIGLYLRDRLLGTTAYWFFLPSPAANLQDARQSRLSGDARWLATLGFDGGFATSDGLLHVVVLDHGGSIADAVDRSAAGALADARAQHPAISDDGRFVAWDSAAGNLDPSVTRRRGSVATDVFWHDRVTGATRCLSATLRGIAGTGDCICGGISDDGRRVVFTSTSTALVPAGGGAVGVYVADVAAGSLVRVDVGLGGLPASGDAQSCAISGDGRFVVFASAAANLVGGDTNGVADVFVTDLAATTPPATVRVSVDDRGIQANGLSVAPTISDDGRTVAFATVATNLVVGDTNGAVDIVVVERGPAANRRVNLRPDDSQSAGGSFVPRLAGGGTVVGWSSPAADLVAGDTNAADDAFVAATGRGIPIHRPPRLPAWLIALLDRLFAPTARG